MEEGDLVQDLLGQEGEFPILKPLGLKPEEKVGGANWLEG